MSFSASMEIKIFGDVTLFRLVNNLERIVFFKVKEFREKL
jgi:hypothetical protein